MFCLFTLGVVWRLGVGCLVVVSFCCVLLLVNVCRLLLMVLLAVYYVLVGVWFRIVGLVRVAGCYLLLCAVVGFVSGNCVRIGLR